MDFRWKEHRTIAEFDGLVKYEAPGALAAEKLREDRLREQGEEVVRFTWPDLDRPQMVRTRVQEAFARAATRHAA